MERVEITGAVTKITIVEIGVNNTRTAYMTVRTEVGEYKVTAPESGRTPDFDRIPPGTVVRVAGRMKEDSRTIMAHNIEIKNRQEDRI